MTKRMTQFTKLAWFGGLVIWSATLLAAPEESGPQVAGNGGSQKAVSPAEAVKSNGDYRVGSADVINVAVWREPEVSTTVVVRPDGKISVPLIKDLSVAGMTTMEIQAVVEEELFPFLNSPNVTVTVREINSKNVYVIGEVGSPGVYVIKQPTTVLQILTQAGGLRLFAKKNSVYVLRVENGDQQRFPFKYKEVLKGKNMEQNIFLKPGDTIVVP